VEERREALGLQYSATQVIKVSKGSRVGVGWGNRGSWSMASLRRSTEGVVNEEPRVIFWQPVLIFFGTQDPAEMVDFVWHI
jgi:hypothetical protein